MKLVQYSGPFNANETITIPAEYGTTYVHIGVQVPYRYPIAHTDERLSADLEIGSSSADYKSFRINDRGILEFEDITNASMHVKFLKNLPMESIVDIAYTTSGE